MRFFDYYNIKKWEREREREKSLLFITQPQNSIYVQGDFTYELGEYLWFDIYGVKGYK